MTAHIFTLVTFKNLVCHDGVDFVILGTKNNKSDKGKSLKDPNSEPSSLFQREGVHMLLGELSRKFPPQFLQQGQAQTGDYTLCSSAPVF